MLGVDRTVLSYRGSVKLYSVLESYIVYLGEHSHGPDVTSADLRRVTNSHYEFLGSFLGSVDKAKDAMIYSYKRHINGFAALLEEHEAAEITRHPDVLSLFLDKSRTLHTTHSWEFMNVEKSGGEVPSNSIWNKARFGRDVIIANLDTGVWPESQSFNDNGFGPVPKKWKGLCQNETSPTGVRCNRKLIGAKYFNKGYLSSDEGKNLSPHMHTPRDYEGHGTHTLSTLGGSFVPGASISGAGNGTAKGGSPGARVAAYKICWPTTKDGGCYDSDVMKAIDAAIHDGVDVISMSLGGDPGDYFNDGIAIGAFHAVRKGIAVVCSAGNSGPYPGTVTNVAPWIITVGASTLDREFQSNVKLQNGQCIKGTSMSPALPDQKMYPLINSADAKASNASAQNATLCMAGAIDPKKVKGKILVCQRGISARVEKGHVAATAGAVGMILCNDEASANEIIADAHVLPATQITYNDGLKLYKYLQSSEEPQGSITPPKAVLQTKPAPVMAAFSSRGPNKVTPEILKPDVTAPGVNIIAAYSQGTSPTGLPFDHRTFPFNVDSGTSMSCPHVSGIVGLLRILHPHWSPAALRSALITTAGTKDNTGNTIRDADDKAATPFAYGAGHVRPNRAADPGLVYDLSITDHLNFLCASGYNHSSIKTFSGGKHHYKCPENIDLLSFNYPSITVPNLSGTVTVIRTVKNVGKPATYVAVLRQPQGISVSVEPKVLNFEKIGEEKRFKVTFEAKEDVEGYVFGELIWSDGRHHVTSPIAVAVSS
nr:subtilisin-like protease SBT5.4 [Ipomoea trifida]